MHSVIMWLYFIIIVVFSHLFAIASTAYGRMMKNTENQVIVIRYVLCMSLISGAPFNPFNFSLTLLHSEWPKLHDEEH